MEIITLDPPLINLPRRTDCELLVLHSTAGSSLSGAINTLRQRELGYHFLIPKTGPAVKCMPASRYTWHAGSSYGPREAARGVSRKQDKYKKFIAGCTVNEYSVSISFVNENDGQHPYTDNQDAYAVWIAQQLQKQFPKLKYVSTHAILSPGRKTDPIKYDLDRFAKLVGLLAWKG